MPENIPTATLSNIIDIAAGTCIWTLEVADLPDIKERLQAPPDGQTPPINLYACDVNFGNFPAEEVLKDRGIKTLKQDVTQPFPEDMHGSFDLVHMTLMVWVFSESQWKAALENCYKLLSMPYFLLFEVHVATQSSGCVRRTRRIPYARRNRPFHLH